MEEGSGFGRGETGLPKKAFKVKNKAPANVQITAEQIIREAKSRQLDVVPKKKPVEITDSEELAEFQRRKRKEFEDNIRKNRIQLNNWTKYAKFEESIGELQRARSVYERCLELDPKIPTVWLQYAEMEMKNKQISHARNVFDRAVTILPRCMQFWLKYAYMEEIVENVPGARQVFERWMAWEPDEQAWQTYINFELKYNEIDRARVIYQQFLHVHGDVIKNWIKYAKFEERHGYEANARVAFEKAMEFFGDENLSGYILTEFARFEERHKEYERARVIYQYGLDNLPKEECGEIFKLYAIHEKKHGSRKDIEDVVAIKRKAEYEKEIDGNCYNYDGWFDYLRLLIDFDASQEEIEDTFERAVANVPLSENKVDWRRYIHLWLKYAWWYELNLKNTDGARKVYKACLDIIPHKKFTFSKIWIALSDLELRCLDIQASRKVLGQAIGICPRDKLFRHYINREIQLREFERCRTLYEKWISLNPENAKVWNGFAELETMLDDVERARSIYELAINYPNLEMPELVWKSYIDFECEQENDEKVRELFEALLKKTTHGKVFKTYAEFEIGVEEFDRARAVYERANKALSESPKDERVALFELWKSFEKKHGTDESRAKIQALAPRKVRKRRQIQTADGIDGGWEEFYEYVFPQDQATKGGLKLFEAAKRWKKQAESVVV
uniref:TPR_REGION domain-containing protein n=1 Tax=Rhabditophanes sp. KR3021 TaxID=114890 RepID=A0AC35UCE2_9BILA